MRHMIPILVCLVGTLCSCSPSPVRSPEEYARRCKSLASECLENCVSGSFNTCYIDTKLFPKPPYNMTSHCHGTHVGSMCYPCSHLFSFNFGGSMRQVSCEEFLEGLDRKNQQCDNCLKKFGESPFSF